MLRQLTSENTVILDFDQYRVILPKGDIKKEWNKLTEYMDLKLRDYTYEEPEHPITKSLREHVEPSSKRLTMKSIQDCDIV